MRVSFAERNDKALIVEVLPRSRELVRKDPTERAVPQVLAANFDRVIVTQPSVEVNMRRLERELVLAHETGAAVSVVLTKADLAESEDEVERVRERVRALVGADVETLVVSEAMPESVEAVRALVPEGTTAVLIGRSGVGKSSLVNLLVGRDVQETGTVRETDGAGRWCPFPPAATWSTCQACAVWASGMPTQVSALPSPTWKSLPSSAASAIASTRTSLVARFAPLSSVAISRGSASSPTFP